jgi:hypothetical protein
MIDSFEKQEENKTRNNRIGKTRNSRKGKVEYNKKKEQKKKQERKLKKKRNIKKFINSSFSTSFCFRNPEKDGVGGACKEFWL